MGRGPGSGFPVALLAVSIAAALVGAGSACGLTDTATRADATYGPLCDELATLPGPAHWVSDDGRLALDAADAARLMIGLGVGAAAGGGPDSPQAQVRDLLADRSGGRIQPLSTGERAALGRLQAWADETCD